VFYREEGRDEDIISLFKSRVNVIEAPNPPTEAFCRFRMLLANALSRQGQREEAFAMLKPAVEAFLKTGSTDMDLYSKIVRNCGSNLSELGRAAEGLDLMKREEPAFAGLNEESLEIAKFWMILGKLYKRTRAYEEAVPHSLKCYEMAVRISAPEGEIGSLALELGDSYRLAGLLAKAEPLLEKAVTLCERAYGEEAVETAEAYTGYGGFFSQGHNDAKAILYLTKGLAAAETSGTPATAQLAAKILANVYRRTGRGGLAAQYEAKVWRRRFSRSTTTRPCSMAIASTA
jgi:tetratricopeptide (TPR) repeat protein